VAAVLLRERTARVVQSQQTEKAYQNWYFSALLGSEIIAAMARFLMWMSDPSPASQPMISGIA